MQIIRLLTLLLCLLPLGACGNKGPVRPLETPVPGAVKAPELRQQGDALLLGWQLPSSYQDGTPLEQPPVVDIYRMSFDPADDCPECFDRSELLTSINPQLPAPAQQLGERYLLHDRSLQAERGYQYKLIVRTANADRSRPVILRQTYSDPVPAPQQVKISPQDRSALLQWQPPTLKAGDNLAGYLIYRRSDDSLGSYPLNSQPLDEIRFEDFSLKNGTRYYYRVRALVKRGESQIEGLASPEQSVTPESGI